jgi:DNA-binding response OmpR family regulator
VARAVLVQLRVLAARTLSMSARIVIAEADATTRGWLRPALAAVAAQIHEVSDGNELERLLESDGPFDLVITSAQLPLQSGLQVLARARSRGVLTPFVVVTSVHEYLLRVFVSDAEGTVLSSRMVDRDNLLTLAMNLIDASKSR